jgi:hypothetical protein
VCTQLRDKESKDSLKFAELALLILVNKEDKENLEIIRDIRFSENRDPHNPGVPIILISISSLGYSKIAPEETAYLHLIDNGVALNIPFTLNDLRECLGRAIQYDHELLKHVRDSFNKSALVQVYTHGMYDYNYKERLKYIEEVVPTDLREQIRKLMEKNFETVRRDLEIIKGRIEEIEREGNIPDEKS